jgi:hypothetical protein
VVTGGGGEDWGKSGWKGQKESLGGRTMDCSTGEGGKVKRGKNGDKRRMMVKLIKQE